MDDEFASDDEVVDDMKREDDATDRGDVDKILDEIDNPQPDDIYNDKLLDVVNTINDDTIPDIDTVVDMGIENRIPRSTRDPSGPSSVLANTLLVSNLVADLQQLNDITHIIDTGPIVSEPPNDQSGKRDKSPPAPPKQPQPKKSENTQPQQAQQARPATEAENKDIQDVINEDPQTAPRNMRSIRDRVKQSRALVKTPAPVAKTPEPVIDHPVYQHLRRHSTGRYRHSQAPVGKKPGLIEDHELYQHLKKQDELQAKRDDEEYAEKQMRQQIEQEKQELWVKKSQYVEDEVNQKWMSRLDRANHESLISLREYVTLIEFKTKHWKLIQSDKQLKRDVQFLLGKYNMYLGYDKAVSWITKVRAAITKQALSLDNRYFSVDEQIHFADQQVNHIMKNAYYAANVWLKKDQVPRHKKSELYNTSRKKWKRVNEAIFQNQTFKRSDYNPTEDEIKQYNEDADHLENPDTLYEDYQKEVDIKGNFMAGVSHGSKAPPERNKDTQVVKDKGSNVHRLKHGDSGSGGSSGGHVHKSGSRKQRHRSHTQTHVKQGGGGGSSKPKPKPKPKPRSRKPGGISSSRSIRGPGKTTHHRPSAPQGLQRGAKLPLRGSYDPLRGVGFDPGRGHISYFDKFKKK